MEGQRESWRVQTDTLWHTRDRTLHSARSLRTKTLAHTTACDALSASITARSGELERVRLDKESMQGELARAKARIQELEALVALQEEELQKSSSSTGKHISHKTNGMKKSSTNPSNKVGKRRVPQVSNHMVESLLELESRIRWMGQQYPGYDDEYEYVLQVEPT
eukprot:PhF_6_TR27542/c0_g1_i2/m.40405